MNCIGKVDNRRALRKSDNVALGSKHKRLVVENIDLEQTHEFLGVTVIVLVFDKL